MVNTSTPSSGSGWTRPLSSFQTSYWKNMILTVRSSSIGITPPDEVLTCGD